CSSGPTRRCRTIGTASTSDPTWVRGLLFRSESSSQKSATCAPEWLLASSAYVEPCWGVGTGSVGVPGDTGWGPVIGLRYAVTRRPVSPGQSRRGDYWPWHDR